MDPKLGNKVYKLKGLRGKKTFRSVCTHTHILHRKNIWKAFRPNVVFSMLKFHGACHYMYKSKSRTGFLDFSYFSLGSFNPGNQFLHANNMKAMVITIGLGSCHVQACRCVANDVRKTNVDTNGKVAMPFGETMSQEQGWIL